MFLIFIFFWVIALFILLEENHRASDTWIAIALLLFGCGGLSAFAMCIREQTDLLEVFPWGWIISGTAASLSLVWGPYALLIFALFYSGLMPKNKIKRAVSFVLLTLPVILFYILVPAMKLFGQQLPLEVRIGQTKILAAVFTPYYWGTFGILLWQLLKKNEVSRKFEDTIIFLIVIPPSISYYFISYFFPSFGYQDLWPISIFSIIFVLAAFTFFFIKRNVFGLSFYQPAAKAEIGKRTIECVDYIRRKIKGDLMQINKALENAESSDKKHPPEMDNVLKEVGTALESCENSLDMLDKVRKRMNPVFGEISERPLLMLLEQSIERSLALYPEREITVYRSYPAEQAVDCDPVHLENAISEIIVNAVEATEAEKAAKIYVDVRLSRKGIMIRIRDNGGGVGPELVSTLGLPMFTTKQAGQHLGLGLYYAKKVVDMHGGRFILAAHSQEGLEAKIILPRKRAA